MDSFYTDNHFTDFYEELKNSYKTDPQTVVAKIRQKFMLQYNNDVKTPTKIQDLHHMQLYKLKVILEGKFMRDVKCNYKFILTPTPAKVGCDIRELIFNIENTTIRDSFLENITLSSRYLINNIFKTKIPHILTDIDDTLYPSKSSFLQTSGRDTSWKNKEPYPGIRKFYELFYNSLPDESAQYSTVLTATPMFLKETKMEDETICEILGPDFGFIQGVETKREALGVILAGMKDQPFYHFAPSAVKIGAEKFKKFRQYRKIFPEYQLFFIGDNGQGDLLAGKMMIQESADTLVFIHNIVYEDKFLFTKAEESAHQSTTDGRLFFFKNYLELGYIFTNVLNIFTRAQYETFKEAVIVDIQTGLETIPKPNKNLYQHYTCCDDIKTCISPESCIKTDDLLTKRKTLKRRLSRCRTRKLPRLPKSPTPNP